MSHYTHFSITERRKLRAFLDMNLSIPTIAKRLNRHRSTLYREIERNKEEHSYSAGGAHKKNSDKKNGKPNLQIRG
ncbi:MAG: helix-turn-helix domain-containing protein [Gammaproteobacteria bacterium]|nr:helix-turn-helix domain-containing protein [Gammaproteobacteria bacterium]